MPDLNKICDDFQREAEDDYVGLWQIINAIERNFKTTSIDERRFLTLEVVKKLIGNGLEAVNLEAAGGGCIPWPDQNVESILMQINAEWDELGRQPDIGDIVWFNKKLN